MGKYDKHELKQIRKLAVERAKHIGLGTEKTIQTHADQIAGNAHNGLLDPKQLLNKYQSTQRKYY